MSVTNQPIQLSYFVADIAVALATYSRLRWHRSQTGQYGLYSPVTAALPQAAVVDGSAVEPHQINGKTLNFRVNGTTTVSVVFSDPDPVSTAQAVVAIGMATPLVVASDVGGLLRLTSVLTGSIGSIEILEGDANPYLGFETGSGATGKDADTILLPGVHEYLYTDQSSDRDYWYRTEFYHHATARSSGLGVPFPALKAQSVAIAKTVACHIRLSDMTGFPLVGRCITLFNPFLPNTVVDQSVRWGIFRHYAQMMTDSNGYAEIRLLRGMTLDISIGGTGFVRRIQIPATGDAVDLLDPVLVTTDEFGIQEPSVDFAIRTS